MLGQRSEVPEREPAPIVGMARDLLCVRGDVGLSGRVDRGRPEVGHEPRSDFHCLDDLEFASGSGRDRE